MMFNKYMVVCDTEADIRNPETLAALLRGVDMRSAVIRGSGPLDVLDHATATPGMGGKLALDLTGVGLVAGLSTGPGVGRKTGVSAEPVAELSAVPDNITICGGVESFDLSLVAKWGIMIIYAAPDKHIDIPAFLARNNLTSIKIAVIIDTCSIALTPYELLWVAAANSDPTRDVLLAKITSDGEIISEINDKQVRSSTKTTRGDVENAHGVAGNAYSSTLIVDARTKLPGRDGNPLRFPNVVTSSQSVIELVDSRWEEYGLGMDDQQCDCREEKYHSDEKKAEKRHHSDEKKEDSIGAINPVMPKGMGTEDEQYHKAGKELSSGKIPESPSRRYRSLLRSGKAEI